MHEGKLITLNLNKFFQKLLFFSRFFSTQATIILFVTPLSCLLLIYFFLSFSAPLQKLRVNMSCFRIFFTCTPHYPHSQIFPSLFGFREKVKQVIVEINFRKIVGSNRKFKNDLCGKRQKLFLVLFSFPLKLIQHKYRKKKTPLETDSKSLIFAGFFVNVSLKLANVSNPK